MRGLRAARAHLGPLVLLAAVEAVLVGGVAAVVTRAEDGGGRTATALGLVVLGLVTLPLPALELGRRRRAEVTLARLRGADTPSLLAAVAGLPVVAVLLGAATGVGAAAAQRAPRGAALDWALAATGGSALLTAGCAATVLAEPLASAVKDRVRATAPGLPALLGGIAVVVAATAAGYRAWAVGGVPGALVLAGPALVGVAAGQVAVWLLRATGPALARAVGHGPAGLLLGVRSALARDHHVRLRVAVGAGVLVAASAAGAGAATAWGEESARVTHGAPVQVSLPGTGALDALLLTRRLDPEGRWLMAASVALTQAQPDADDRVAWLDLARIDRVAGGFVDAAATVAGDAARLRDAAPVQEVTGDELTVAASADRPADLTLTYLDDDRDVVTVVVTAPGDGRAPITDCAASCVVLRLEADHRARVVSLDLGGTDLLATRWADADGDLRDLGALTLRPGEELVPAAATTPAPVLVAGDAVWPATGPAVTTIGGSTRRVDPVATVAALPLVGASGVVGDLSVGLAAGADSVPAYRTLVLARSDTPPDVLAGLADAGGEPPVAAGDGTAELAGGTLADSRARRLVGTAAALLGLLALLAGTGRRRRRAGDDQAALALVGVGRRDRRRATLVEALVLAVVVAAATAAGSWVAVVTLVQDSALVPTGPTVLPLGDVVTVAGVALPALAAAGALALLGVATSRAGVRRDPRRLLAGDTT